VLELEGAIFFGTVERLADAIERAVRDGARFLVLDLGRVTDVDMTGGRLLTQIHADRAAHGGHLLLTGLNEHTRWGRMLRDLDVTSAVAGDRPFPDSDRAIEWAEDHLIATAVGDQAVTEGFAVEDLELFRGLDRTDLATVRAMLEPRHYTTGDVVIAEGADGRTSFSSCAAAPACTCGGGTAARPGRSASRPAPCWASSRFSIARRAPPPSWPTPSSSATS
jgi:sulfate permease, SulP family